MSKFLNQVQQAVKEMDESPYDDKKTIEHCVEATKKTVELCRKLEAETDNSNLSFPHGEDFSSSR